MEITEIVQVAGSCWAIESLQRGAPTRQPLLRWRSWDTS